MYILPEKVCVCVMCVEEKLERQTLEGYLGTEISMKFKFLILFKINFSVMFTC